MCFAIRSDSIRLWFLCCCLFLQDFSYFGQRKSLTKLGIDVVHWLSPSKRRHGGFPCALIRSKILNMIEIPIAYFRNFLREILNANRHISEHLHAAGADQVTESMIAVRKLSIRERLSFYVRNRIDEQRRWYSKKSSANRRALRIWIFLTCSIYISAIVCLNAYR